jgi:hypothetical protein
MLKNRRLGLITLCASILFAAPAPAAVTYAFTSEQGDFTYVSPSFFGGGNLPDGVLESHSGNFDDVFFGSSYLLLQNAACKFKDNCFQPSFGGKGIFLRTGTYFGSDPNFAPEGDAKLVISGSPMPAPVPELSSWAMLGLGLAGLAFARGRRIIAAASTAQVQSALRSLFSPSG